MSDKRPVFTPWRSDFINAGVLAALAVFALVSGFSSGRFDTGVAGIFLATILAVGAKSSWVNGRRRWHGKNLELWAVEKLGGLLDRKQVPWESGRMVPGLGDVDVLVETKKGLVAVEIKSFELWRNEWRITGNKIGQREADAIAQVAAQRDALGAARAIVWLPRGRPRLMQRVLGVRHAGVRVVFGNASAVWRRLK